MNSWKVNLRIRIKDKYQNKKNAKNLQKKIVVQKSGEQLKYRQIKW